MGKYILSVGIAALIVGILTDFTDSKSSLGVLSRMVCSLFLVIVAIQPLSNLNDSYLSAFADTYDTAARAAVNAGTKLADDARRQIIKAEAEAYILDKASLYDLQLEVQVTLAQGDAAMPEKVYLTGKASPYARNRLQMLIADELGVPKEQQIWIG